MRGRGFERVSAREGGVEGGHFPCSSPTVWVVVQRVWGVAVWAYHDACHDPTTKDKTIQRNETKRRKKEKKKKRKGVEEVRTSRATSKEENHEEKERKGTDPRTKPRDGANPRVKK